MRAATACALSASSWPKVVGTELVRHDAAEVVLERQLVDDVQRVADVAEDVERSPIAARVDLQQRAARLDARAAARRQHETD